MWGTIWLDGYHRYRSHICRHSPPLRPPALLRRPSAPPSSRSLPRPCTHPGTHVLRCIIAIIPVVGDALHPVIGYLLVVRQASKAKYVFAVIPSPHPIAFSPTESHSRLSFPFFLFHAGFPRRSRGA